MPDNKTIRETVPGDAALFFLETGETVLAGWNLHRFMGEEDALCRFFEFVWNVARQMPLPEEIWGIGKSGSSVMLYTRFNRYRWSKEDRQVNTSLGTCYFSYLDPGYPRLVTAVSWAQPAPRLNISPSIIQLGDYIGQVVLRAATMACNYSRATVEWNSLWSHFYHLALGDSLLGRVDGLRIYEEEYARWLGGHGFKVLPPDGAPEESVRYTRMWWERFATIG